MDPVEILGLTEEDFRRRFRRTAIYRAKRGGLLRNAAIVLGNQGNASALPALERVLADHDPQVRDAAAWAIQRIRSTVGPITDRPGASSGRLETGPTPV